MNSHERHHALFLKELEPTHRLIYEGYCHCGGILYRWEDTGKLACHFCSTPMKLKLNIEKENIISQNEILSNRADNQRT